MILRRLLVGLGLVAVGVAVAWLVLPSFITPEEAESIRNPPTPDPVVATVEVGVLREIMVLTGEVRPVVEISVSPWQPLGATRPVVTFLPEPGSEIASGEAVVGLSSRPLIFVSGMGHLYRDLHRGMRGPDVAALQTALFELGYLANPEAVNGTFNFATESAVADWYQDIGFTPASPPEPVTSESPPGAPRLIVPAEEILGLPHDLLIVEGTSYKEGELVDGMNPIIRLRTSETVVLASATLAQSNRISVGQPVVLRIEDREVPSRVVEVVSADPGSLVDAHVRIEAGLVSITPGTPVTVEIELQATTGEVVSVPISAIRTNADGRSFVTVANGDTLTDVEVEIGITIGGRTEIISGLDGGESVVVG